MVNDIITTTKGRKKIKNKKGRFLPFLDFPFSFVYMLPSNFPIYEIIPMSIFVEIVLS